MGDTLPPSEAGRRAQTTSIPPSVSLHACHVMGEAGREEWVGDLPPSSGGGWVCVPEHWGGAACCLGGGGGGEGADLGEYMTSYIPTIQIPHLHDGGGGSTTYSHYS